MAYVPHVQIEKPPMNNCDYQRKINYNTWKCYTRAEYQEVVRREAEYNEQDKYDGAPIIFNIFFLLGMILWFIYNMDRGFLWLLVQLSLISTAWYLIYNLIF